MSEQYLSLLKEFPSETTEIRSSTCYVTIDVRPKENKKREKSVIIEIHNQI